MSQTTSAVTSLLSAEHPHISRHTSIYSILVSSSIALLGILSIVGSFHLGASSDTLAMAMLTVGTIVVLVGLYRIFWRSTEVVYLPTGSALSEGSCYMDSCDLPEMSRLVKEKNFSISAPMTFRQSGNGRLDYLISKDGQFAAVQLFRFVPYNYEPASEVYYYTGEDAVAFTRYLKVK